MRKGIQNPISLLLTLLTFWVVASGSVQAETSNRIVAVVNNEIITWRELEKTLRNLLHKEPQEVRSEEQKQILFQMVDQKLVEIQIKRLGIQITPEELNQTIDRIRQEQGLTTAEKFAAALARDMITEQEFRDKIREQLLRFKLVNREIKSKIVIPEAKVREYYQQNRSNFQESEKVHLALILITVPQNSPPEAARKAREKAEQIRSRLHQGEDFSTLAKTYSQDASAGQGGDLGTFRHDEIDASLNQVVKGLKVGEVSPVLESARGWQIIKLIDRQGAKEVHFNEVKGRIHEVLFQEEVDARFQQWLSKLRDRSHIQILL